jgi:hypothetical protein
VILPFSRANLAVFAVFAGNYQRELTFHPQKPSMYGPAAREITAGFGLAHPSQINRSTHRVMLRPVDIQPQKWFYCDKDI